MPISFPHYPGANRVSGVYVDVDPSHANTGVAIQRSLIIGQQLSTGTFTPGVPVQCLSWADTVAKAGAGSMLERMVAAYRAHDDFADLWLLPLADDAGASAATGSIAFTAGATAAGTLAVRIADRLVNVGITTTMTTAAQVAQAVQTALAADPYLIVTASLATATVNLTAKNKGAVGNDIQISIAAGGVLAGESVPAGITYTIPGFSGGATNPSLATPLLNLGEKAYDYIALPYTDSTSLDAIKAFMADDVGRWAWSRMIYGHVFAAARGSLGTLTTLGSARNDPHVTIMGFNGSLSWVAWWAASLAGAAAAILRNDPAMPLQYIPLHVSAPPIASRFVLGDRNTLLYTGISTFIVQDDGTVETERLVSTYQINPAGAPDNSYLDVETLATLAYVNRDLRTFLLTTYPRKVLVSDDTPVPTGSNRVSPSSIKAAIIARIYHLQNVVGVIQNADAFAANIVVENAGNGLVKVLAPADLANQLRQIAILMQFVKS